MRGAGCKWPSSANRSLSVILTSAVALVGCKHRPVEQSSVRQQPSSQHQVTSMLYKNVGEYADECAAEVGYLPPFSCDDGIWTPIFQLGKEVSRSDLQAKQPAECDNPTLLKGGDGACAPSQLLRLKVYEDRSLTVEAQQRDAIAICRPYSNAKLDSGLFNDIALIAHNRLTGATCFFQMYEEGAGRSGKLVPSPNALSGSDNFWLTPPNNSFAECSTCHEADPFIHTPYVMRVRGWGDSPKQSPHSKYYAQVPSSAPMVPSNPNGKYYPVGTKEPFIKWRPPVVVSRSDAPLCTSCHRLGKGQGCLFSKNAVGEAIGSGRGAANMEFPNSHWMPMPGKQRFKQSLSGEPSLDSWERNFREEATKIFECCSNAENLPKECQLKPLEFWSRPER